MIAPLIVALCRSIKPNADVCFAAAAAAAAAAAVAIVVVVVIVVRTSQAQFSLTVASIKRFSVYFYECWRAHTRQVR